MQPRETHYTFSPLETGHTDELCVRINIKDKSEKRLSLSLSESVTSDVPFTGSEVITPARTSSTPQLARVQLAGAWAARAQVIRPPLEPRSKTRTPDSSYPPSDTSSVSSLSGSMASNENDARPKITAAGLQGAWSNKAGATGAQIVSGQGNMLFRIGSPPPKPHPSATPTLRHCASNPAITGSKEQHSKKCVTPFITKPYSCMQ